MNLDGYVTVNERLKLALAKYPDLRVEELPFDIVEIGGQTNLHCTIRVYTTPDDTRPVLGSVLEPIPGRTPYTRNSELMVGMTSALGRALGYLGFGIDKGIARTTKSPPESAPTASSTTPCRLSPEPKLARVRKQELRRPLKPR